MPVYYVDTSALVKRYHIEPGLIEFIQEFGWPHRLLLSLGTVSMKSYPSDGSFGRRHEFPDGIEDHFELTIVLLF